MAPKRALTEADQLASMVAQARAELARAGRALHDDVGPLLAGAGLYLSTAPGDPAVTASLEALDQAMERVRAISQQLNPSPVDRMGLHKALLALHDSCPAVEVEYAASVRLSREGASAVYDAIAASVAAAARARARRIRIEVSGETTLRALVRDNGRRVGRERSLSLSIRLASAAGVRMSLTTRDGTIVSIAYGVRRSAGG